MRISSCVIPSLLLCALTGCQSTSPETFLLLKNPGFEGASINKNIPGWDHEEHAGPWNANAFEMIIEPNAGPGGGPALRVTRIHKEEYGFVYQKVPVGADAAGKTFIFSARMSTENAGPRGWVLVANLQSNNGILDQKRSIPIVGTTGWQTAEVVGTIPKGTAFIDIGFMLHDSGTGRAAQPTLSVD